MNTRRTMAMAVGAALLAAGAFAAPSVEITSVQQQYPWTNTVDIVYTVAGVASETNGYFVVFTPTTSTGAAIPDVNGETSVQVALKGSGVYSTQWFPQTNLQYTACKMTPTVFRGAAKDYMIVDLLTGEVSYEPMATQDASNKRYNTAEYKTTKMVLRRVEAGKYDIMDGATTATMDKAYYIGVFEVTVGQYNAILGSGETTSSQGMNSISYNTIRSSALPAAKVPDTGNGVVAKLNRSVHAAGNADLYFDLPTESMWEVACRAKCPADWCRHFGTTSPTDGTNLADYAWYADTTSNVHTPRTVGLKKPNGWGLYDMYGNSWEWCLDAVAGNINDGTGKTNPMGGLSTTQSPSTSGANRVLRGACHHDAAALVRSSMRWCSASPGNGDHAFGFRLAMIVGR